MSASNYLYALFFWLPVAFASEPRDLSSIVAPIVQKSGVPAFGAAIVTSAGLQAIGVAGVRSSNHEQKVTVDDQWHLGSCTKTMTATLTARLVDHGVLTWETTIGDVFGKAMPDMHAAWKSVPIIWLLSHRSGASLNFSKELWEDMLKRGGTPREQRRYFVQEGLKVAPSKTPNTETGYSNAGYMIAGAMLETLTDTAWEELVTREVFKPLGMTRTGFGPPGTAGKLDQPVGHTRGKDGWSAIGHGPDADNPLAVGPGGTVHASLGDWSKFIAAHLSGARGNTTFLKSATWKRLHEEGGPGWGYSPGWVIAQQAWAGGKLLRHMGSNGYWLAEASLSPGKDFAVLIVTNAADDSIEVPFKKLLETLVADRLGGGK